MPYNNKFALVQFFGSSWSTFGGYFWDPFWNPKLVQNLLIFGSILDPFFLGFRSSLGGLKSEKMQTVPRENHFFENVAFLVFEALDGPFILPPLWLIWSENGPQNGLQKWFKKWSKNGSQNDPKTDQKSGFQNAFDFEKIAPTEIDVSKIF